MCNCDEFHVCGVHAGLARWQPDYFLEPDNGDPYNDQPAEPHVSEFEVIDR